MTDLREAAEFALEAMEKYCECGGLEDPIEELRQALAQPEQEQYVTKVVAMHEDGTYTTERIPLPKREWQGLTVNEVFECWKTGDVVAAVEAKLKEKNT